MNNLIDVLDDPEAAFPDNFNTPRRANALLFGLCQEAAEQLKTKRNDTLEEVAKEFDKMPFGDTAASFAIYVRNMKK